LLTAKPANVRPVSTTSLSKLLASPTFMKKKKENKKTKQNKIGYNNLT
jgi:hypothetical protein